MLTGVHLETGTQLVVKNHLHVTLVHLHNDESNGTIHTTTCVHS